MSCLTREGRSQERCRQFFGGLHADDPGAQHQNVHVIVFDTLMSGIMVVAQTGSNAADFISRNGGANPASADQDTALCNSIANGQPDRFGAVGIVVIRLGLVWAQIDNVVARGLQMRRE